MLKRNAFNDLFKLTFFPNEQHLLFDETRYKQFHDYESSLSNYDFASFEKNLFWTCFFATSMFFFCVAVESIGYIFWECFYWKERKKLTHCTQYWDKKTFFVKILVLHFKILSSKVSMSIIVQK